jgi:hypothetical protein
MHFAVESAYLLILNICYQYCWFILSASGKVMTEKEFDAWVKKVLGKLDDFVEVIPAK